MKQRVSKRGLLYGVTSRIKATMKGWSWRVSQVACRSVLWAKTVAVNQACFRSGLTEKTRRPGRSGACPVTGRLRRVAHALDRRGQPLTFSYEERIDAIRLTRSIGTATIPNLVMGARQSGEGGPVWLPANAFQV